MKTFKTMAAVATTMLFFLLVSTLHSAAQEKKLTDPEIASIAVTANQVDIDYAGVAKSKSKNADILKFAEIMSNDHKAVIAQAVALVKKLKVTPKDNAVSKKLLADAETTQKALLSKSGKAFDKAYIDNEVAYHKAVISVVETMLIPGSQNGELRSLLENVVPALKAHLGHAEMLQANYK